MAEQAQQFTEKREVRPWKEFALKFQNDWAFNLSAALAYHLLLATFPVLVALLSLLGLVFGFMGRDATKSVTDMMVSALPSVTNPQGVVQGVQSNLKASSGILGIIAVVSAILVGARLFALLETFFSIVYHVRPRPIVRRMVIAIAVFILSIFLVPVMSLAASIPVLLASFLQATPLGHFAFLTSAASLLGGVLAAFLLFLAIYVIVPNLHIRLRHGWKGAIVSAVALQLYLVLFPLYAAHFLKGAVGAVGFAAILLVFFYYFAVLLFLGAEVNAYFVERVRPTPNDLATFYSTMAGKVNEDIPEDESEARVDTRPTEHRDKERSVNYVAETREQDVPPRVARNPRVQREVTKRQQPEHES
ncbi:YihY/virulence factor BrkB family protein [Ktedonobacter robiniae]|uniref:Uncharacterized protein n=1 Tax=Ktedonobacter robiniae TaxID=2778365 RepID=A0ABQ3UGU8_9CHLR|nr:YihY/virulence factor BrkB family protein [Ktedonobacter robiniae]GHO51924.1 hypothetical protein KSB_03990 [Ktedonobacter robiniae]